MGALGYYLELAGVATTQVSLIREHTAAINPPRALWVPFMLGRPLGVPHDKEFQERVLLAVLRLLEKPSGPVLADYPEEAPPSADNDADAVACPVSFGRVQDTDDLGTLFLREIEQLLPWHDMARERRGRTAVGLSGIPIAQVAAMLISSLKGDEVARLPGLSVSESLKVACEDVRTYYYEAAAARPGTPNGSAIQHWFWHDTVAGRLFLALYRTWLAGADKSLQQLCGTSLVPKTVLVNLPKT